MAVDSRLAWVILTALVWLSAGCRQDDRAVVEVPSPGAPPGLRVEAVEEYWSGGSLKVRKHVARHSDGTLVAHGVEMRWHPNGKKAYEATFIQGKIHGVEKQWHQNGRKSVEQHYDHGLRHGPRTTWDGNGRKRKEENFSEDKPDGVWTVWNKNGKIKVQSRFDRGTPQP